MTRDEIMQLVKSGRRVVIQLDGAEVVHARSELRPISHYSSARLHKIMTKHPVYGTIYFSGFSQKLADIEYGDKVSLKLTVTGVGDPSDRYPDPILFAKPSLRKGDSLSVDKPIVAEPDLIVNV